MSITITDTMVAFAIIGLAPALLFMWLFLHQTRMNKDHRMLMRRTFIFGTLAIVPVYIINYLLTYFFDFDIQNFLHTSTVSKSIGYVFLGCVLIAVIEEYAKGLIVREVDWKRKEFSRVVDGIEFSVACGLGFAFAENAIYFWDIYNMVGNIHTELMWAIIFRSTLSMLAHAVFSGIFGYYYGRAKMLSLNYQRTRETHHHMKFHLLKALKIRVHRIKHILKWENLHNELKEEIKEKELVAEGLLVAVILHTCYNFFLTINLAWISVIIIAVEFLVIIHEFELHKNNITVRKE